MERIGLLLDIALAILALTWVTAAFIRPPKKRPNYTIVVACVVFAGLAASRGRWVWSLVFVAGLIVELSALRTCREEQEA